MRLKRFYDELDQYQKPHKVLVLYGPRRVGKTNLIQHFLERYHEPVLSVAGDNLDVQEILGSTRLSLLKEYVSGYSLLAIDEAQRIPNIGQNLKLIVDHIPDLNIIITGSSSIEIAGQIGESLVGRKTTLMLFPMAALELKLIYNRYELRQHLEKMLIYGSFPEVMAEEVKSERQSILQDIAHSYLLKDILELDKIKHSKTLLDLLRLIAFQIGGEVSYAELASQLNVDTKTVIRYLDLFEKSFILYNLRGFSRNLRKEITKKSIYYFYDNGIRNAIINNFNSLSLRNDVGMLWENYLFMERLKKNHCANSIPNQYFWRTWDKQEIDLIEEKDGILSGFDFKYSSAKHTIPRAWKENYPESSWQIIHRENYLDFIL